MNWYMSVIKDNYANFNGRARRKEYWMFVLVNFIICIVLGALSTIPRAGAVFNTIYYLYSLAIIVPSLAVLVRRLHDIGKAWPWIFISLIPLVGWIWILVLLLTEGDAGKNLFGDDPKAEAVEAPQDAEPVEIVPEETVVQEEPKQVEIEIQEDTNP